MTDFSALQKKLARLAVSPGFLLDDRTVQQRLTFLKNYTHYIPFGPNTHWDSLLFPKDWPVDKLADIYQQPELAAGNLPPLQAFVLTFLRLLETPLTLLNYFPAAHRELYYRQQLGLAERKAEPTRVALAMQLTADTPELLIPAGLRFSAGQDSQGTPINYQLDNDVLACQAYLTDMYWVNKGSDGQLYQHIVCEPNKLPDFPVAGVTLMAVSSQDNVINKYGSVKKDKNRSADKNERITIDEPVSKSDPVSKSKAVNTEGTVNKSQSLDNDKTVTESYPGIDISLATLYLGFGNIHPGQTLSLFWQLKSPGAFAVKWQYLDRTLGWKNLKTLSCDETQSFLGSGLWQAILPDDSDCDDKSRCWLRVSFPSGETLYPELKGLLVNAMTATLCDVKLLDAGVLAQPLTAEQISQPVSLQEGLSGVLQPFASFAGRAAESAGEFFARTAQRLSHRNRALSWKELALLLKTEFPAVFDVITPSIDTLIMIPAPTEQKLVVLPRAESCDNDDLLRPTFSSYHMQEMQQWLNRHSSFWQNIKVINPDYQTVNVAFDVTWHAGVNPDFARSQLKQQLTHHYMPWSQPHGGELVTGSQLDYYDMIARIQDDPHICQVDSLTLNSEAKNISCTDIQVLVLDFN
jgi:hypothetical protein